MMAKRYRSDGGITVGQHPLIAPEVPYSILVFMRHQGIHTKDDLECHLDAMIPSKRMEECVAWIQHNVRGDWILCDFNLPGECTLDGLETTLTSSG